MTEELLLYIALAVVAVCVIVQIALIYFNGKPVAVPDIPRQLRTGDNGSPLRYVVMGDSTAISQGSEYDDGFAVASTAYLARNHIVTMLNTGVSGATTPEVARDQLHAAVEFRPDIVLLAAGANDATHFTRSRSTERAVRSIIDGLREMNPQVQIVMTGAPAIDSVSRFPVGSKWLLRLRTSQVNQVFEQLVEEKNVTFAPIAERTRQAFLADPTLTAADNFHPNARGYALWIPIINDAIHEARTTPTTL